MADYNDTVGMSDDDFLNLPLPGDENLQQRFEDEDSDASVAEEEQLAAERSDDVSNEDDGEDHRDYEGRDDFDDADEETEVPTNKTDSEETDDESEEEEESEEDDSDDDVETDDSEEEEEVDEKSTDEASEDAEDDKSDKPTTDAESNWTELTKPFRANNTEMKVDNVEDARRLMSMGANYHKKMVDMKEDRKFIETLRDNELLDSTKLNLLIDASKGNQAAITELLKQSKINPLDIDVDGTSDYTPTSYQTSDEKLAVRDVLSTLRDTATYEQTMTIATKKWDGASQEAIMGKPEVLNVLNDHVASGVYEVIAAEVAQQQVLGKLKGLNDVQAYIQVGNELEEAGKFKAVNKPTDGDEPKAKSKKPAPKKVVKPADKAKRKRAGAPKQRAPKQVTLDDDNLSDEEFAKQFNKLNH